MKSNAKHDNIVSIIILTSAENSYWKNLKLYKILQLHGIVKPKKKLINYKVK